jgi:hypothetical protein
VVERSKTIDNLGAELERDYIKRLESLPEGENFLRPATLVSQQTEVSVVKPAVTSEIDLLFGNTEQTPTWATFAPPPHDMPPNALFSHELVPYLRCDMSALKEQQKKRKKGSMADESLASKEEKSIETLFSLLSDLNKWLETVNNNRLELTKG